MMIRSTILEIALVISGVFLSIPLWQSFNLDEYETVAMQYDNMSYTDFEISDLSDYTLYQTSDDLAIKHLKTININMNNNSNTKENYNLWMIVDKDSTLDYNYLKINYNNEISYLNEHKTIEDEKYFYILLDEGSIIANNINTELQIWIDSGTKEDITNKYLSFDIENNPGQVL